MRPGFDTGAKWALEATREWEEARSVNVKVADRHQLGCQAWFTQRQGIMGDSRGTRRRQREQWMEHMDWSKTVGIRVAESTEHAGRGVPIVSIGAGGR